MAHTKEFGHAKHISSKGKKTISFPFLKKKRKEGKKTQ
jgi:hypothetical protein